MTNALLLTTGAPTPMPADDKQVKGISPFDMSAVSHVEELGPVGAGEPMEPYDASPALRIRHWNELVGVIRAFLVEAQLPDRIGLPDLVDYLTVKSRNPAVGQHITTPVNLTAWLFMIVRALQPRIVVESGVFKGSSLFTMRCASPRHKMFAFDVDFSWLTHRFDAVDYRERDWGLDDVRAEGPTDLCYFNDHVNNCLRIRQAYERGFKHLVLDDTPDLGEIRAYRYPAVPTVSMIVSGKFQDGDAVDWVWQGQRLRYTFRTEHTFGARELIDHCHPIPALHRWTGLQDSNAYYVKLK